MKIIENLSENNLDFRNFHKFYSTLWFDYVLITLIPSAMITTDLNDSSNEVVKRDK